jgi:ubiquinone/menaquinone biosynthesis C-methylase UbiE
MNSYRSLMPLIEKKSLICDPQEFQSRVNIIFHDFESASYDDLHDEMWKSLPYQYDLIINDISDNFKPGNNLSLLDIGCGTGLATDMLLKTTFGKSISKISLLDTSKKMLLKAEKRAITWKKKVDYINGQVADTNGEYDIILISSVLHHIPDLDSFLAKVSELQAPGGLLITIHDPTAESLENEIYKERTNSFANYRKSLPFKKGPILTRIGNKVKKIIGVDDYIQKVNKKLLAEQIIKEPLTETELWSITDIHVEDLPYSTGLGIPKRLLSDNLKKYALVSYRTYSFFGLLSNHLDARYQKWEQDLSLKNDMNGRNFCSAWLKNIV